MLILKIAAQHYTHSREACKKHYAANRVVVTHFPGLKQQAANYQV